VLDEPSIGLHSRDNERLIAILRQLRDQGNTVLVVEHDADMIRVADTVVDCALEELAEDSDLSTELLSKAVRASAEQYAYDWLQARQEAKAEREGTLRERLRFLCRPQLLIIDEIGYLPVIAGGGNLVFQLVNARYERGAMILTSNRGFAEWGDIFGSPVVATALLDRLLHHAIVVQIEGASYRLRQHADLIPENLRVRPLAPPQPSSRRRGRPPKDRSSDLPAG